MYNKFNWTNLVPEGHLEKSSMKLLFEIQQYLQYKKHYFCFCYKKD